MRKAEPPDDLPEGWEVTTYKFSGNFKLIARFDHEESGAEVRVNPYKTYEQPGFANAHRVILIDPCEGVKEIAVGMDVERGEEAEQIARKVMNQF
ncbi:hypothetical protein HYG81_21335 (plasmid) [Natrinema zhouii]|uniref:hypothetical protein n=1 Tax=Natrinema zhouii TaxID=1710539 RepID=UPI001CFF93C7|nr:hypothetical protein [Natrinema zhouii]UHQ98125.1 hypothetical protein HYG81_21335 [Natrinema zhouii]